MRLTYKKKGRSRADPAFTLFYKMQAQLERQGQAPIVHGAHACSGSASAVRSTFKRFGFARTYGHSTLYVACECPRRIVLALKKKGLGCTNGNVDLGPLKSPEPTLVRLTGRSGGEAEWRLALYLLWMVHSKYVGL